MSSSLATSAAPSAARLPCDLCSSTETEELCLNDREGKFLRTVICRNCGLVFSDPRPRPEQVRDYYEKNYRVEYKATFQPKPKHSYRAARVAMERYSRLKKWLRAGDRMLDFGAGAGEVVFVLRAMGYDAEGIEPNDGYAQFARESLGMPVRQGFYQDAGMADGSVDFVTAFHVVEHLESPLDALQHIWRWLRPQGRLVVEVPCVEGVAQWPKNRFHQAHLYNFNLPCMEMLGRKAGFKVMEGSLSEDGGNLTVVLEKVADAPNVTGAIAGNFQRVASTVRGHTALRHLFTSYPYTRPISRLLARMEEKKAMKHFTTVREMFEGLIARDLKRST